MPQLLYRAVVLCSTRVWPSTGRTTTSTVCYCMFIVLYQLTLVQWLPQFLEMRDRMREGIDEQISIGEYLKLKRQGVDYFADLTNEYDLDLTKEDRDSLRNYE